MTTISVCEDVEATRKFTVRVPLKRHSGFILLRRRFPPTLLSSTLTNPLPETFENSTTRYDLQCGGLQTISPANV